MKFKLCILLSILINCQTAYSQYIEVQLIDDKNGSYLSTNDISKATVILVKANSEVINFGLVDDGKFLIEDTCHPGDQYRIEVQSGDYKSSRLTYCTKIIKNGLKLGLLSYRSEEILAKNSNVNSFENYNNDIAVAQILLLTNTELASNYLYLDQDTNSYNESAQLAYQSLAKLLDVQDASVFDESQNLVVMTPELKEAVKEYQAINNLYNQSGQANFETIKHMSEISIKDVYNLDSKKLYEVASIKLDDDFQNQDFH